MMRLQEVGVHALVGLVLCGSLGIAIVDKANRAAFMDITQTFASGYLGYLAKDKIDRIRDTE